MIQTARPDIVVKAKDKDKIIDIAVPGNARVEDKEKENVEKYQDLARELHRLWETSVNVIPVVVGWRTWGGGKVRRVFFGDD